MVKSVKEMIGEARTQIELVPPEDGSTEMTAGDPVLLDIREPVEWESHIPGAVQVPRGLLEFVADPASPRYNAALQPDRRVIVYCASGARASLATRRIHCAVAGSVVQSCHGRIRPRRPRGTGRSGRIVRFGLG